MLHPPSTVVVWYDIGEGYRNTIYSFLSCEREGLGDLDMIDPCSHRDQYLLEDL